MKLIDLDDDRHCFTGNCGYYENWNIDPDIPIVEAIPVDAIKGFKDMLMLHKVFGNEEERIASEYGIIALDALLDAHNEANKHE